MAAAFACATHDGAHSWCSCHTCAPTPVAALASLRQALVQFTEAAAAPEAKAALDGTQLPLYLAPSHPVPVLLRVMHSPLADVAVRQQSERARCAGQGVMETNAPLDPRYGLTTNAPLVLGPTSVPPASFLKGLPESQCAVGGFGGGTPIPAAAAAAAAAAVGLSGHGTRQRRRLLRAARHGGWGAATRSCGLLLACLYLQGAHTTGVSSHATTAQHAKPSLHAISLSALCLQIDDVEYAPTLQALSQVFSVYGPLAKMLLLCRAGMWQALVQYKSAAAAAAAKQYLNGHAMYPGGANKVRRHNSFCCPYGAGCRARLR